jgi:tetratricopeptide (TPR) repeat protein
MARGPSASRPGPHREVLVALGRDEEALGWYQGLAEHDFFSLPYLAPSHLRRAEICEKLGRNDQAIFHYRRFLELWKDCDPELRPTLERARQRLDRLTAGRG